MNEKGTEKMNGQSVGKKSIFAILSMSLLILGPQAISPAMAGLMQHFSDHPASTIRLVISLPLITLVLFTLLTGTLEKRFDKKRIALFGIALYTVAGLVSVFSVSFAMLVICRLILGAGLGLFTSYGVAFLSMLLAGEERKRYIGFQSTACNVGSLVLTMLAGILAALRWNATFLIYAVGIIPFVLVLRHVPPFPPEAAHVQGDKAPKGSGWNGRLILVTIGNVLFFLVFFLVFSDFSVLVMTSGLGSASDGGVGLSLLSVTALIVSLFYKQLSGGLGRFVAPIGVAAAGIGFGLIGSATTLTLANVGAAILGLGFGIIMPHCYAPLLCSGGSGGGGTVSTSGSGVSDLCHELGLFQLLLCTQSGAPFRFPGGAGENHLYLRRHHHDPVFLCADPSIPLSAGGEILDQTISLTERRKPW